MASEKFAAQLNEQIGNEFAAHQQYVAIACHFDGLTMPQMAQLFFDQALEERDHAMMMVRYLLDADAPVAIPGVASPVTEFTDVVAPIQLAVDQEKLVTRQINELTAIARSEHDFASDQFMQWFIKEQVEEVAKMNDLLAVVSRSSDDLEAIELWVAREEKAAGDDPTAPPVAGA